jgi:hypothetical protein
MTPGLALLVALFISPSLGEEPGKRKTFTFEEFFVAPIRVHLLSAQDVPDWETTLTTNDLDRILTKINRVWSQAGIQFYIESLVREEAANQELVSELTSQSDLRWLLRLRPEPLKADRRFDLYYIKRMRVNGIYFREAIFVKDTASLRSVPGGIDEPLPRVSSHELGHAFGLPHRQAVTNLMASGTTGTNLNEQEIQQSREAAQRFPWIKSGPALLKRADDLFDADKNQEAAALYEALVKLPVESSILDRAKKRTSQHPVSPPIQGSRK